jgi:hypothetical protein
MKHPLSSDISKLLEKMIKSREGLFIDVLEMENGGITILGELIGE